MPVLVVRVIMESSRPPNPGAHRDPGLTNCWGRRRRRREKRVAWNWSTAGRQCCQEEGHRGGGGKSHRGGKSEGALLCTRTWTWTWTWTWYEYKYNYKYNFTKYCFEYGAFLSQDKKGAKMMESGGKIIMHLACQHNIKRRTYR